jgi:hypothetical protein
MKWTDRLFGGTAGAVTAGVAGVALGAAIRMVLDRAFSAVNDARSLPAKFVDANAEEIETPLHGRAVVVQVGFDPNDAVPEGTRVAFRLQHGARYLKTPASEYADDDGNFLAVNRIIRGTNDKLLSGVLVPYRALPQACPDRIVVVAFAFADKQPVALDRFEISVSPKG